MKEEILHLDDNEYQALKIIKERFPKGPSQRDLAKVLNMSLGMTNNIIKRLAIKGWLIISKVNGRNLSYALTPDGAREVARRSYHYLRRTLGNVLCWKDRIDGLVADACKRGCNRVFLVGNSDVEFIVEHVSKRHGMVFLRSASIDSAELPIGRSGKTLTIYAEGKDLSRELPTDRDPTLCYLKELLL